MCPKESGNGNLAFPPSEAIRVTALPFGRTGFRFSEDASLFISGQVRSPTPFQPPYLSPACPQTCCSRGKQGFLSLQTTPV
ncbi:hypothetical protein AAFF_G00420740 [Aldrovandia affinis]|uniref:Uncharacterized protein n=1 Tax=Aldrovandia affinis TaxID=143900 RepID=A0AAD7WIS3_9TELE|nr:hypothetical protein AAFF_G00420740 [Aldrovandia affinis]